MQHLEPPVFPFPTQSDLVKDKGRGQVWQKALHPLGPRGEVCLGQTPRQGQVKSELFHHVRIAPLHQQRVLARTQPRCAAAPQLRLLDWRAETVKFADAGLCNPLHSLCFAQRFQRQKPAQRHQFKTIADSRGKRCRQVPRGVFQVLNCPGFDRNPYLRGVIVMSRKPDSSG